MSVLARRVPLAALPAAKAVAPVAATQPVLVQETEANWSHTLEKPRSEESGIYSSLSGKLQQTANLINIRRLLFPMLTPMDRDFGDNVFRKMERAKAVRRTKGHAPCRSHVDIEEPIVCSED